MALLSYAGAARRPGVTPGRYDHRAGGLLGYPRGGEGGPAAEGAAEGGGHGREGAVLVLRLRLDPAALGELEEEGVPVHLAGNEDPRLEGVGGHGEDGLRGGSEAPLRAGEAPGLDEVGDDADHRRRRTDGHGEEDLAPEGEVAEAAEGAAEEVEEREDEDLAEEDEGGDLPLSQSREEPRLRDRLHGGPDPLEPDGNHGGGVVGGEHRPGPEEVVLLSRLGVGVHEGQVDGDGGAGGGEALEVGHG